MLPKNGCYKINCVSRRHYSVFVSLTSIKRIFAERFFYFHYANILELESMDTKSDTDPTMKLCFTTILCLRFLFPVVKIRDAMSPSFIKL